MAAIAGLLADSAGNLYGTTYAGGSAGAGVVFRADPGGRETALYTFTGGADGDQPQSGVARDSAGNLYGTTRLGGASNLGVVYRLEPSGKEIVLHSFSGGADGGYPNGVVRDSGGNLYGTTFGGGLGSQTGLQEGVVFKLSLSGQETVLHSFTGLADGGEPQAGVTFDREGDLYGTTVEGGLGTGVVYKIDAAGSYSVIYAFEGACGANPYAPVTVDSAGDIYGTTARPFTVSPVAPRGARPPRQ